MGRCTTLASFLGETYYESAKCAFTPLDCAFYAFFSTRAHYTPTPSLTGLTCGAAT